MKKLIILFLILISQSIFADTKSDSDSLFNWVETVLPDYFSPSNQTSQVWDNYYYRYYPASNTIIATHTVDLDVYVFGDIFGGLVRVDTLGSLMTAAGLSSDSDGDRSGSLTITGRSSEAFDEHSFVPRSFEYTDSGDMMWRGNKAVERDSEWALIVSFVPGSSTQVGAITFSNGWMTDQIVNLSFYKITPIKGVTVDANSITFTNVTGSPRLILNGTLLFK